MDASGGDVLPGLGAGEDPGSCGSCWVDGLVQRYN